ncbi:hypothetical protein ACJRO7_003624 [Eucalyptus globulus]|uniref:YDG domain-containing protein n=1 Tax=Eucalyptus globulus TaxID=34317 RepID=A0ABD3IX85_EUCGL
MSCLPAGCNSHAPLHFNESKRDIRDIIKETKKSVQCLSGASPSMKDKGCMSRLPAGCRSHTPLHFNESKRDIRDIIKETKKSVQCLSGASPSMKDKGCMSRLPAGCRSHTPLHFNESKRDARDIIKETKKSVQCLSGASPSMKDKGCMSRLPAGCRSHTPLHFNQSNRDIRDGIKGTKKSAQCPSGASPGDVPGVEVGDTFYYRMELVVVGLHRPPRSGIDYMGSHPDILATSVVASWDYTDNLSKPNELVYVGQGGMPANDKEREDQKLTRGNLALVNSMNRNKPVRVIRKDRDHTFTYDGLYMVESCRKLRRANRQMVFEFLMKRIPGQPEIGQKKKKMKVVKSS